MKDYSLYVYYKGNDEYPNRKEAFWGKYEELFDKNYKGEDSDKEEAFKEYMANLLMENASDSISMGGASVTQQMIQDQYEKNLRHYFNKSDGVDRY